ncbi:hydroxysqualene dehydroxylase [Polluticoccus soli]|uniref:hydroxysqualene dehydroxylase n=1 Tax=Polluticoccus soli TaxID=3034150 RepID=UPI0023E2539C|nr:FAD-dependent oxidoreductase [Flavipsychrobacter sp. JY13-12]
MNKKVIVIGGGVAGMSAAHELIERGFEVEVYEKNRTYCGGKARSVDVPHTNKKYKDKFLPGEHGFRFFPGFYKHITDTMMRIPFGDGTVHDNLVQVERVKIARFDKLAIETVLKMPVTQEDWNEFFATSHFGTDLTPDEIKLFTSKIWQLLNSCYERRVNDYERVSWWQFMEADSHSENYRALLVNGLTRTLVAANAKFASTKTGGDIFLQLLLNMFDKKIQADRVLNGPTNDVWLTPWLNHLKENGVDYRPGASCTKLEFENGKITGAWISFDGGTPEKVTGDYYILAVPVEVAAPLMTDDMVEYDMTLDGIRKLADSVAWMNGIQFYLNEDVGVGKGHCIYADTPWALTSISQMQFWGDYDIEKRGNGKVKGILSVDISNWDEPGLPPTNKIASKCESLEEIKEEVWAQLKKSLNVCGTEVLRDDMVEYWHIDADIHPSRAKDHPELLRNEEPLLVNRVHTWALRPEAYTRIENLFLASDYVRTFTDLATMEGANEAARRAVNCIIEVSGEEADECAIWNLHEPDLLENARDHDKKRYDKGLPYKDMKRPLLTLVGQVIGWTIAELKKISGKDTVTKPTED